MATHEERITALEEEAARIMRDEILPLRQGLGKLSVQVRTWMKDVDARLGVLERGPALTGYWHASSGDEVSDVHGHYIETVQFVDGRAVMNDTPVIHDHKDGRKAHEHEHSGGMAER